jgi:ribosomal protein L24E
MKVRVCDFCGNKVYGDFLKIRVGYGGPFRAIFKKEVYVFRNFDFCDAKCFLKHFMENITDDPKQLGLF